jgi:hypothetical protein
VSTFVEDDVGQTAHVQNALDNSNSTPCPWWTGLNASTLGLKSGSAGGRGEGGFCLRAPAQGACTYANICEHCPSFHAEPSSLPVLAAERVDARALAADAEKRGWIIEAERHRRLITRLDTLISEARTG